MIILLMGVSGSGKTTVGRLLASQMGWEFADGDDYHPAENIEKMRSGIPLTDADRAPWLASLRAVIAGWTATNKNGVVACSALRQAYRDQLQVGPEVRVVYLKGDGPLVHARMHARTGHFMMEGMLVSQFATLEEPGDAIVVDLRETPQEIVRVIREKLVEKSQPQRPLRFRKERKEKS